MTLSSSNYDIKGTVSYYNGYTVNAGYTLDKGILDRFISVLGDATDAYQRVFAFRIDLRFPADFNLTPEVEKRLVERFVASFKAKIKHNRLMALKLNPNAHNTDVKYSWVREFSVGEVPHYHFMFYLNRDAFSTLGSFKAASGNLYTRLVEAWASALGITVDAANGLVHVTEDAGFHLKKNSANYADVENQLVHNLSYMAKKETKEPDAGRHSYGFSRK